MAQLRGYLPVGAAAEKLGVSPAWVRELVAAGRLDAVKAGRDLLIRTDALHHRLAVVRPHAGRPLAAHIAWAALLAASGEQVGWVSAAELARARRYAMRPLSSWPRIFACRAEPHPVRMLPRAIKRLSTDSETAVGGVAAAMTYGTDLVAPAESSTDLYVTPAVLSRLRAMRGVRWEADEPNVLLHVLPQLPPSATADILGRGTVPVAAVAADLLDQGDQRSRQAAAELLRRAVEPR